MGHGREQRKVARGVNGWRRSKQGLGECVRRVGNRGMMGIRDTVAMLVTRTTRYQGQSRMRKHGVDIEAGMVRAIVTG